VSQDPPPVIACGTYPPALRRLVTQGVSTLPGLCLLARALEKNVQSFQLVSCVVLVDRQHGSNIVLLLLLHW
jgi:hypothetical protein